MKKFEICTSFFILWMLITLCTLNTSNHLTAFSELEFTSNIEISLPFLTLMVLVGMMSTENIINRKNSCR